MRSKLIVTTTRRPSTRARSLANDLARSLPKATRINRGKLNIEELATKALDLGAERVLIVGRGLHGNPGRITFLMISEERYYFYPLIIQLKGVKLMRELHDISSPGRVERCAIVITPGPSIELSELAHSLSEVLGIFYLEEDSLRSLSNAFDNIIVLEEIPSIGTRFVLKFINPRDLKPSGPKLFIKRVLYREPI
ncbi:MAG: hypothetical protein DRJ49_02440 [Thermoprotei archaeon]|nr:MAG: hypothetical protein DRJ49_02440 [Thermoprotei archaeon]